MSPERKKWSPGDVALLRDMNTQPPVLGPVLDFCQQKSRE